MAGLIQKIKGLLGLSDAEEVGTDHRTATGGGTEVTVERTPETASEDAVKGTSTATEDGDEPPVGETTTDDTDGDDSGPAGSGDTTATDESVTEIKGIGVTYSGRLEDAGIVTVGDLADADAESVSEAAEVSESRADGWIEQARNR